MEIILAALIGAIIFIVLLTITMRLLKKNDEEVNVLEMRKKQSNTSFRQNALKKKLEELVEDRTKKSKKLDIEEMCVQAGFHISYGEYRLITYFTGFTFFVAVYAGLQSLLMAVIFAAIATFVPGQLILFIRNKRVSQLEAQVGSFMRLVIERYNSNKDFAKSIQDCVADFKGQEPMYSELIRASADISIGMPVTDVLKKMSKHTGNQYLSRMTDYYEIASELGTTETRQTLLKQALTQYEENRSLKSTLRNELNGPLREGYLMVGMVPLIGMYMAASTPGYKDFMLDTTMGQFAISAIIVVLIGCIWFINKQIGKPLD